MRNEYERSISALNHLDSNISREQWVRIGMAAKSAGLNFEDFHSWSKTTTGKYKGERDCKTTWDSFNKNGAITARTLFSAARANGWCDSASFIEIDRLVTAEISHEKTAATLNVASNAVNPLALDVWNKCVPALSSHEYIVRKNGMADGLRCYPSTEQPLIIHGQNVVGYLVVPCWRGELLQTLQFIPPVKDKKKLNLPGAKFNDGYFSVGEMTEQSCICEGIGQAWAINEVLRCNAVVCFGMGRMMKVAKALRAKYPKAHLVVAPDSGKDKEASAVASAIDGKLVTLPKDKSANYDVNDYVQEHGNAALVSLFARLKAPEMRYKPLSCAELLNTPPMRWMVKGVIPEAGLMALYGASGSGKSFLVLSLGFAIASGDKYWFGYRVTKAPVTYICLEGEAGLSKRIKAWRTHFFHEPIPDELRFITQPFNLLSEDVPELAQSIISAGGSNGLIIIDTLNRAAPCADENSSVDMGKIISAAKELQSKVGGVVLLVHHTGKDTTKGLRGHSSLYAALDSAVETIKTGNRREWSIAKSKDDVTGNSNPFKLEPVNLAIDECGDDITSCVALFDGSVEAIKKQISLGGNQKITLEEINRQLLISIHEGKEGVPPFSKCLNYDEIVLLVAERMPTDKKHQKSSAKTAITGLIKRCCLDMRGDWLWKV